jgi:hypothetical protein
MIPLWRYIDFAKYVAMLDTASLYFSRHDLLGDDYEGAMSEPDVRDWYGTVEDMGVDSGIPTGLYIDEMKDLVRQRRRSCFVNCWHASDIESVAMWRVYSAMGRGIAVRSSPLRLREALPSDVFLSMVAYIDYRLDAMGSYSRWICKRREYDYERELRVLLVRDGAESQPGVAVPVDLHRLMATVHLAPRSPTWVVQLVKNVSRKYGLDVEVLESRLDVPPRDVVEPAP